MTTWKFSACLLADLSDPRFNMGAAFGNPESKRYSCATSDIQERRRTILTVNPIKLETGLRPNRAGIPYTLLLRVEAIGFPTFGLLLYYLIKASWTLGSGFEVDIGALRITYTIFWGGVLIVFL